MWKGVATLDVVEQTLVSGIVENSFSTWKRGAWCQPDFLGSFSSHQLIVLSTRNFFIIPVEPDDFLEVRRVVGQSSAKA